MRFTSSVVGALAFAGAAVAKEMAVNEELARSEYTRLSENCEHVLIGFSLL